MKETQYIYNLISEEKKKKKERKSISNNTSSTGHLSSIKHKTENLKQDGKEKRTPGL